MTSESLLGVEVFRANSDSGSVVVSLRLRGQELCPDDH
jgi:hypothetical protein